MRRPSFPWHMYGTEDSLGELEMGQPGKRRAAGGMTLDEIDAIVVGKAPDLFEGVMMPELFLAESLGAAASWAPSGIKGTDVSNWQPSLNWSSLWNQGSRFAYVKTSEGDSIRNSLFQQQYAGAGAVGIAGAAVLAAGGKGRDAIAEVADEASPPKQASGRGYHETDHVRKYYDTTKV